MLEYQNKKKKFAKSYPPIWSKELFVIKKYFFVDY